jgi:glycerophosphoryl diester phosphodiesterase
MLRFAAAVTLSAIALPFALAVPGSPAAHAELVVPTAPWHQVLDIAHRGASGYAPENTLASFRLAGKMGADVSELDVQETRDHQLVVIHDTTLTRTTNVKKVFPKLKPWRVRNLTLKQIKRLDAGSWFKKSFRNERVPTLAQALRTIQKSGTGLLLELKQADLYPGMSDQVIALLDADPYWRSSPDLIVQSFSWRYLRPVHDRLPFARTAALGRPTVAQMLGLRWYTDIVHPSYTSITPEYARDVQAQGMDLFAYTVDDRTAMRRMIGLGADGIVTDRPDVLRRILQL